jgi:hypothetical protein
MPLFSLCSVEGEAPSSETGTSLDSPSSYHQGPLVPGSSLSPDHYEHTSVGAYGLYSGQQQQRTRRPRLQHSTSILRKQAEEEAIKRSRSLSESYELSSDLQDKQVGRHSGEMHRVCPLGWPSASQLPGPLVAGRFQPWCLLRCAEGISWSPDIFSGDFCRVAFK